MINDITNISSTSDRDAGELERVLAEYRSRLDQVIRKEKDRQRQLIDEQTNDIINIAYKRAENLVAEGQRKALIVAAEIEQKAQREAALTLQEAKNRAEEIVHEVEERLRKECKERSRKEVENILKKTREEAGEVQEQARRDAESEANNILAKAKLEAEQIRRKSIDEAKAQAQLEATRLLEESKDKSEKLADNTIECLKGINAILNDGILKADGIVEKFKKEVQEGLEDISHTIAESNKMLSQVTDDLQSVGMTQTSVEEEPSAAQSSVIEIRATRIQDKGHKLFKGRMELKTITPCNPVQIRYITEPLLQVPEIKLAGEYGSDEGTKVIFEINEPGVPLLDILGKLTPVANIVEDEDSIRLMLKPWLSAVSARKAA